jgi:hypothetical protein
VTALPSLPFTVRPQGGAMADNRRQKLQEHSARQSTGQTSAAAGQAGQAGVSEAAPTESAVEASPTSETVAADAAQAAAQAAPESVPGGPESTESSTEFGAPAAQEAPAEEAAALDDEALKRILKAVGSKFIPANLDRDGLRADIQLAAWWWMQITGEKSGLARLRLRRLQDIRRAAEELKRLLEEDAQSGLALSKYPFTGSDPPTILNQLINYANRVLEPLDGTQTWPKGSAFDWVMGSLMETYSRYFQRKAGISRLGRKVKGPFIRFAEAALRELKIFNDGTAYSRETIARAVTALKRL